MDKYKIADQIETGMSNADWGGWADAIDGMIVDGKYEVGCDREFPNFESGYYICSLRQKDGVWIADVTVNGGGLEISIR